MTFSTQTIRGPAGRLAVTTAGEGGVPVLFVHGNSGNRTQWAAQQAHLKQRSVSLDLRGMGESEPDAAGRYHYRELAEDVGAVAEGLGLERFVLVGHSLGCAVVAEYAARHPERVVGLVLADPGDSVKELPPQVVEAFRAMFLPERYEAGRLRWFEPFLRDARAGTRAAVLDSLRATPREVVFGAIWSLFELEPAEQLSRYPGPRLVIAAAHTLEAFGARALHRRVPGIEVKALSGVSHWLMMDDPEGFNAALDAFLLRAA
jgi:pimeloyl-ACP methyl ester carboxylesterase